MVNKIGVLAYILTFILCLQGLSGQVLVTIECFPTNFTLTINGETQNPVEIRRFSRLFRLPGGRQALTLSAPEHQSKTVELEIQRGMVPFREKLEPVAGPLRMIAEVETGYQPKSVRFTPDGKHLAVALLAGRGMEIYTVNPLRRLTYCIPGNYGEERGFVETAMLPEKGEIWLSQMTTAMIHVFRISDWSYVESFPTGGNWSKVIYIDKQEQRAYVSNWTSYNVSVINVQTRQVERVLQMPGIPRGLTLNEDESILYVTNFSNSSVSRFRTSDWRTLSPISIGEGGAMRHAVTFGSEIILGDMGLGKVHSIDGATGRLLHSLRLTWNINTIDVNPDGRYIFASARGTNNPESYLKVGPDYGRIYVMDRTDLRLLQTVWGRNQPTGLAVSPDSKLLAFTDFLSANLELYSIESP